MKNKKNEVREERRQTRGGFVPTNNPLHLAVIVSSGEKNQGDAGWQVIQCGGGRGRGSCEQLRAGAVSYLTDTSH